MLRNPVQGKAYHFGCVINYVIMCSSICIHNLTYQLIFIPVYITRVIIKIRIQNNTLHLYTNIIIINSDYHDINYSILNYTYLPIDTLSYRRNKGHYLTYRTAEPPLRRRLTPVRIGWASLGQYGEESSAVWDRRLMP